MKKIILTAIALLITTTAFAQTPPPQRHTRTLVVRDGKVITDESDGIPFDFLLGGPRAFLGVSLMNLSPELREHFGAPEDAGVMVESVQDGSPADKAGVKVGDIVLSVDGKEVKSSGDLRTGLKDKKDGDSVRLEVLRGRTRQTIVTTVKEREAPRVMKLDELPGLMGSPEWRARFERFGGDCGDLQTRIKELETRLKDLEKKLQK
ncbi:MAG TPA: PDZ domain-containing protein [Thermoanaerobaculia bacterium]|jgi:membrane-associated protease RseP (regulator of RpoE activity)